MNKHPVALIQIAIMILLLSACVSTTATYPDADAQIWKGSISGMVVGDLDMKIWEVENLTGSQKTQSRVSLEIIRTPDGYNGTVQGTITGFINDGKYNGKFFGHAVVEDGESPVRGKLTGDFSDTKGSGTWDITADKIGARFTGKWALQRQ